MHRAKGDRLVCARVLPVSDNGPMKHINSFSFSYTLISIQNGVILQTFKGKNIVSTPLTPHKVFPNQNISKMIIVGCYAFPRNLMQTKKDSF